MSYICPDLVLHSDQAYTAIMDIEHIWTKTEENNLTMLKYTFSDKLPRVANMV